MIVLIVFVQYQSVYSQARLTRPEKVVWTCADTDAADNTTFAGKLSWILRVLPTIMNYHPGYDVGAKCKQMNRCWNRSRRQKLSLIANSC